MVALSKTKKNERIEYVEYRRLEEKYRESVLLSIASAFRKEYDDNFLDPLASKVTKKTFTRAMDIIGDKAFSIDDGKIRVDVTVVTSVYNTSLNGSVSYYSVEKLVRNGKDVDHDTTFKISSSWGADRNEMLFEAIDDILDKITDFAYDTYNAVCREINETKGKK